VHVSTPKRARVRDETLELIQSSRDQVGAIGNATESAITDHPYRSVCIALGIGCSLLPAATLGEAVRENRPQLLWVSVSSIESVPQFLDEYARLYETAAELGTAVAVGGRALTEEIRQQMVYSAYCDTLRHLVTFVATLSRQGVEHK